MASGTWTLRGKIFDDYSGMSQSDLLEILETLIPDETIKEEEHMSTTNGNKDDTYINAPDAGDDFDFVMAYDDDPAEADERLLPENVATSAISCGFIGVGGGGGKLAKAFLDLGFNKTILVNTTEKDQPGGLDASHFVLVPGADGVGKDITLGKQVLQENSAFVEDAVRTRLGQIDWLFVCAGGGGGTGSACHELHGSLSRYLSSIESSGKVVYIITKPTAQEMLNPTISNNYKSLMEDISETPHILLDNEKQLQLLRGKVGMMNMFPAANRNFAKLLAQVLKLADEHTEIQTFATKDLEKCLSTDGRIVIGSTILTDTNRRELGAAILQGCISASPCPPPGSKSQTGALMLIASSIMVGDPAVSKNLEAAFSYVGGRTQALFSGVYVRDRIPGLIAICLLAG